MNFDRWKRINEIVQGQIAYLNDFEKAANQSLVETQRIASEVASSPDIPAGLDAIVSRDVEAAIMASGAAGRDVAVKDAVVNALADSLGVDEAESVATNVIGNSLEGTADDLFWASVASRSRSYTAAAQATYENQARVGMVDRLREVVTGSDVQIIERRVLGVSHMSCDTCLDQAALEWQPEGELNEIGDSECLSFCNCSFEFRVAGAMRDSDQLDEEMPYGVESLPMAGAYRVDPSAMPLRGGRARQ